MLSTIIAATMYSMDCACLVYLFYLALEDSHRLVPYFWVELHRGEGGDDNVQNCEQLETIVIRNHLPLWLASWFKVWKFVSAVATSDIMLVKIAPHIIL